MKAFTSKPGFLVLFSKRGTPMARPIALWQPIINVFVILSSHYEKQMFSKSLSPKEVK